jgi:tetratricopeptide (TPR) repeat protein
LYLSGYDRDIKYSTQDIESARDDAGRAAGYARRGRAYSEKARYCRAFKLIPSDEYDRLFRLAVKDHDQAVALAPGSAEAYFSRGQTYYDRAALEDARDAKSWFDQAGADFQNAVERDGRHYMAWDMLGLVHEQAGEMDKAIRDFTQEMALNPLGRARLADAYCTRGSSDQREKSYDAAIADYEQAIEIGATADSCSCDPYNPLVALYDGVSRRYDKGWEVVHKAQKSKRWIAPELLETLKKDSGRNQ